MIRLCPKFNALSGRLAHLAALLAIGLIAAGAAVAEPAYSFDTTPGKLPKTVVPIHYAIDLKLNLESRTIAGSEVVEIEVREPTARLVLNAGNMKLTAATIDNGAQKAAIALDDDFRGRDADLSAAARRRPPSAAHRLHRTHRQIRPRPLPDRLSDRPGQEADGNQPSRARGRPQSVPVLGRAGLQGDIRAHRHGATLVPCGQQHAGSARAAGQRDPEESLVPADPENVELPAAAYGGRAGADQRRGRRGDGRRDHDRRQAHAGPLRARQRDRAAALLQRLFRREISAAEARPDRRAARPRQRHGALGCRYLPGAPPAVRCRGKRGNRAARHLLPHRPRAGAPVVRQSRHHGLVGQPLAQRGLRHLDGSQGDRAFPSAMADLAQQQREAIRHERGCARHRAGGAAAGGRHERGGGDVRRHHLRQGGRRRPHARRLSRRGRLSRGAAQVPFQSRLRQHHDRRSVAGARGRVGQAGGRHRGALHRAARRSSRRRRDGLRRRRAASGAAAGALQRRQRCRHPVLPRKQWHSGERAAAEPLAGAGRGRTAAGVAARRNRAAAGRAEGNRAPGVAASR